MNKGLNKNHFKQVVAPVIAAQLNAHHVRISYDEEYVPSLVKITIENRDAVCAISEVIVFNVLDRLKTTAPGHDNLP